MKVGGAIGHHQNENQVDRLTVGRIERNRLASPDQRADGFAQPLEAAVRDRNAVAERGGTQFFTRKQAVEYLSAREVLMIFKQQPGLLEHPFLAGDIEVQQHIFQRQ